MILTRLHKWFLSLALLVSVVSFNGYVNGTTFIKRNTSELVVIKKPISKSTSYFYGLTNSRPNTHSLFNFESLLKNYNLKDDISFEISNNKTLDYLNHLHFIMISHTYSQNDIIVSSLV